MIAEGYATAVSLHMATNKPVVVAFDAGNLEPVALAVRGKYPEAKLVICADNDRPNEQRGNVGLEKAEAAALAVNGVVSAPQFKAKEAEQGMSDFNDLHKARGLPAVQKAVASAVMKLDPQKSRKSGKDMGR